jgi:hypothetical protein
MMNDEAAKLVAIIFHRRLSPAKRHHPKTKARFSASKFAARMRIGIARAVS